MTNVFEYSNYKSFLEATLKSSSAKRGQQSAMARHLGCQASYLYQVIKGKADLTEDQAYKATVFFKFSELERDYFLCLVRHAKATSKELKDFLHNEITAKLEHVRDLKNRVNAAVTSSDDKFWEYYFSSTLPSLIHILTSSKKYQTPPTIAERLAIPEGEVLFHLKKLEEKNLVSLREKKWNFATSSLHFPKDSSHNRQIQVSRRLQSLQKIDRGILAYNTHFSTLFTLDPESFKKLQELVANFVESSHKVIHKGGTDEAYILSLDLFKA